MCVYALYYCNGDFDWALNYLRHADVPVWTAAEDALVTSVESETIKATKGLVACINRVKYLRGTE